MTAPTFAPALPATMHAAVITEHGPAATSRVQEVATPRAGPGELLIRVGVDVAGTIASGPRAGERVLVDPAIGCGRCRQCRRGEIYQHHRQILGAPMGNWQDFLSVTRLVFSGQLIPKVYAVYPLERIADAEDALEDRPHFGKIVVSIN